MCPCPCQYHQYDRSPGSNLWIYEMSRSSLYQSSKRPLRLHRHGEYQYQCIRLFGKFLATLVWLEHNRWYNKTLMLMTVLHDGDLPTNLYQIEPSLHKVRQHKLNYEHVTNWACSIANHIIIQSLHNRTVLLEIESVELILVGRFILRSDLFYDLNILIGMEGCKSLFSGLDVVDFGETIILNIWWFTI